MSIARKTKNATPKIVDVKDFNVTKLSFSEIDFAKKNEKPEKGKIAYGQTQYISFPRYDEQLPTFRAGWIQMSCRGIPSLGEYYKDDAARDFVQIPLLEERHLPQPYKGKPFTPKELLARQFTLQSCKELRKMMSNIDNYIMKNKSKILGKFAEKFEYQPIIRVPQASDDLNEDKDEDSEPVERPDYLKFKLMTNFESKELETALYTCEEIGEDGKAIGTVKQNDVRTITDLCEYHNWFCVARNIFRMVKLWAARSPNKDTGKRTFGVTFKIAQILVKPGEIKSGGGVSDMGFGFDDDCVTMEVDEVSKLAGDDDGAPMETDEEVRSDREEQPEEQPEEEPEEEQDEAPPPPPPKKTAVKKTPAKGRK